MKLNFAADIPADLLDADELLHKFGRWAMWRQPRTHCGSAEGRFQPGRGESLDARREAREVLLDPATAMACQRALARVPDKERLVLELLYVPRHVGQRLVSIEVQVRLLRLPARLCQERHLAGLRMFANLSRIALQSALPGRGAGDLCRWQVSASPKAETSAPSMRSAHTASIPR